MKKIFASFKYWGSALVIIAILVSSIVSIKQSHKKKAKAEYYEAVSDIFLGRTDVDADQTKLDSIYFYGLKAYYEPKWVVNPFCVDTEFGHTYIVAFNANGDDFRAAYSVTWFEVDPSQSLDEMMKRCRKLLKDQYKGTTIETRFSEPSSDVALGRHGESLDLYLQSGGYSINRRVIIFRENGYEFHIEKTSDISRESLDTFFNDLESRINIDAITR